MISFLLRVPQTLHVQNFGFWVRISGFGLFGTISANSVVVCQPWLQAKSLRRHLGRRWLQRCAAETAAE